MKLWASVILILCVSCQQCRQKKYYKINEGEKFRFQVIRSRTEGYYWEWQNQENVSAVTVDSRIYSEKFLFKKMRTSGIETWTIKGINIGTDTLKLYLRTYEEDTVNIHVADSLIIVVKVKRKLLL